MKTKKADIRITFRDGGGKESVEVAAVFEGKDMSMLDRDVETVTILLMAVVATIGNDSLRPEDFFDLCSKAYAKGQESSMQRTRFEIPVDGLPN